MYLGGNPRLLPFGSVYPQVMHLYREISRRNGPPDCGLLRSSDLFQAVGGSSKPRCAPELSEARCRFPVSEPMQTPRPCKRGEGTVRGHQPDRLLRAGGLCHLPSRKDRNVLRSGLNHQTNMQAPPPSWRMRPAITAVSVRTGEPVSRTACGTRGSGPLVSSISTAP